MTILVAVVRLAVASLVGFAVVSTFFDTASRATINPFNFFGFFTMQSNIATAIVLLIAAIFCFRGKEHPRWLVIARGCVTTYIAIVGIVYNTLLAGLEGGVSLEWANWVLHVFLPIYAVLDWILIADRPALPWRVYPLVLIYPIVWIVVVLIRGATDGWVPYPFLDPATGYPTVAVFCVIIAVGFAIVGAVVWAISRFDLQQIGKQRES